MSRASKPERYRLVSITDLNARNVPSIYIVTSRIGQVQESSEKHQPTGIITEMGTGSGHRILLRTVYVVEILLTMH